MPWQRLVSEDLGSKKRPTAVFLSEKVNRGMFVGGFVLWGRVVRCWQSCEPQGGAEGYLDSFCGPGTLRCFLGESPCSSRRRQVVRYAIVSLMRDPTPTGVAWQTWFAGKLLQTYMGCETRGRIFTSIRSIITSFSPKPNVEHASSFAHRQPEPCPYT